MATATGNANKTARTADTEDQIYDSIRHAVLTQQLTSGTRLPELSLSQIFNVNRSVVRRALVRLTRDYIVVMRRNKSAIVAHPTPEETAQLFAARRHVEAQVMRETAGHLSDSARAEVESLVAAEHQAHGEGHHDDRIHLSLHFHERLADACPNQVLARILHELILRTSITVALYKVPGMAACYRSEDHRGIADAVFDGDGERAARLANEHLEYLEHRLSYANRDEQYDLAHILGN